VLKMSSLLTHQLQNAENATGPTDSPVPSLHDEQTPGKRPRLAEDDDEDSDESVGKTEKRAGRRKIKIEYIDDKSRRHITFSKRKAGIMKKVYLSLIQAYFVFVFFLL